jgi:hypothetical protein
LLDSTCIDALISQSLLQFFIDDFKAYSKHHVFSRCTPLLAYVCDGLTIPVFRQRDRELERRWQGNGEGIEVCQSAQSFSCIFLVANISHVRSSHVRIEEIETRSPRLT